MIEAARDSLRRFVLALQVDYPDLDDDRAMQLALAYVGGEYHELPALDEPMTAVWQRMRAAETTNDARLRAANAPRWSD
jgi:hypothetical protein